MPTAQEMVNMKFVRKPNQPSGSKKRVRFEDAKKFTPIRRAFAKAYIENGGNGTRALLTARAKVYPDKVYKGVDPQKIASYASHTLKVPSVRAFIQKADASLLKEAEKSVKKLADLRDGSESEEVQLKASSNLISSYLTVTKRLADAEKPDPSTTNILITGMTTEEIMKRIENIKNGTGNA